MDNNENLNVINEIKTIFQAINTAWASGNPEILNDYFHDDIMIVGPDMQVLGKGREVCVQSYVEFLNRSKIVEYSEEEPEVHVFNNTAIVFYKFFMAWETEGEQTSEKGSEVYVFDKLGEKWLVVMRKITK